MGHVMLGKTLLLLFPALMVWAAASDLATMTIPNRLSIVLVGAFGLIAAAGGVSFEAFLMHTAAGALVLAVCFGMFARGWIGGGDAKFAASIALWIGFDTLPDYLVLASLGGGALTFAILFLRDHPLPGVAAEWAWLRRLHDPRAGVPYGVALAGAALAVFPETPIWAAVLNR